MKFGSVCSGIEAASVAWEPMGWSASWLSDIEPAPNAVTAHHWPEVPNLGDMTLIGTQVEMGLAEAPDILVGGTPCQAFSIAGNRLSLADERGQLTLAYIELANIIDDVREENGEEPAIIVWENVKGVLSTSDNAFGCLLAGLAGEECELKPSGKRWSDAGVVVGSKRTVAWRVLDAQHFGVAQRRKRVFVVASSRKGFDPAEILFEREGLRRDTAPVRDEREAFTRVTEGCDGAGCWWDGGQVSQTLDAVLHKGQTMPEKNRFPAVLQVFNNTDHKTGGFAAAEVSQTITSSTDKSRGTPSAIMSFAENQRGELRKSEVMISLNSGGGKPGQGYPAVRVGLGVRKLTPVECERLQGFPDNHTLVPYRGKPMSDTQRYKALGNSMAVPVMRWLGHRIQLAVEESAVVNSEAELIPAWEKCECCDDFICNIHGTHVFECECPGIEDWCERDVYPYEPCIPRPKHE